LLTALPSGKTHIQRRRRRSLDRPTLSEAHHGNANTDFDLLMILNVPHVLLRRRFGVLGRRNVPYEIAFGVKIAKARRATP
jgi:hypothetical protein